MARQQTVQVKHPITGKTHDVRIPAKHDGSRVRVEFPDGEKTWTDGWDPVERALSGERPVVPCAECGEPQTLTAPEFDCSACGAHNTIELKLASDAGNAKDRAIAPGG